MRVRFSAAAVADLESIRDYIAQNNPQAAERVLTRIGDAIELLREFPKLGHSGAVDGTMEMVVPRLPYIIVYETGPELVEEVIILRVHHGAQERP